MWREVVLRFLAGHSVLWSLVNVFDGAKKKKPKAYADWIVSSGIVELGSRLQSGSERN